MTQQTASRQEPCPLARHLVDFDPLHVPHYRFDVVVVGGGAAGGFAALAAADAGRSVAVVMKGPARASNTQWAKGGVAAVLSPADSFEAHVSDTLAVGCGLSDPEVVARVVQGGPEALANMETLGARFDRGADGELSLSKEGGHTHARIVHADGDATGMEMQRAITQALMAHPNVRLFENHFAIDVLRAPGGEVEGALCLSDRHETVAFASTQVILATGGAGQIFRETTNPEIATGDGLAMALRAGAVLRDGEFVQFHPTCLYIAGAARVLISEIVRGAGGILRDRHGTRFMPDHHPAAELAPRDVVSRVVMDQMVATKDTSVYLDLSELQVDPHKAFPAISRHCEFFGIDIARDPIPVRPGAHYMVGGIKVDLEGRTSVPGLWAAGECASTGLHGANRMGSNSLLEALVLGKATGKTAAAEAGQQATRGLTPVQGHMAPEVPDGFRLNVGDLTYSLKSTMWRQMGVQRTESVLDELQNQLRFWMGALSRWPQNSPRVWELQNMLTVSRMAALGAQERQESRGVHARSDFPDRHAGGAYHLELRPDVGGGEHHRGGGHAPAPECAGPNLMRPSEHNTGHRDRVLICGVILPGHPQEFEGELSEARALVGAAEGIVVGEGLVQKRERPSPATLMGKGKVEEVKELVEQHSPDAVVVDNDLTPAQGRNLEKAWCVRVIDRSELILDIFARRAQTRQASLQVELAQNEYMMPRLRRLWTHLERTEGAIGTRGPGETQLETDRRLLNKRITDLKAELAIIERRKQREVASREGQFTVGLVGYTNAGKSTLLNRLTGSDEFAADMPFATLDTRTRKWILPDKRVVLLSDTVGFLQRLPHHLVASFHATLEETLQADLLLHVVDASHPDAHTQMKAVDEVLGSMSARLDPSVIVLNKIDRVQDPLSLHLLTGNTEAEIVHVSAKSGAGIDRLIDVVQVFLDERSTTVDAFVPVTDGKTIAFMRSMGGLLEEEILEQETMRLRLRLSEGAMGLLQTRAQGNARFVPVE